MRIKLPDGFESWSMVNVAIAEFMIEPGPNEAAPKYASNFSPRILLDEVAARLLTTEGRLGPRGIHGPYERYVAILDRGHTPGREKLERIGPMMHAPAKERCAAIIQVLHELEMKELGT